MGVRAQRLRWRAWQTELLSCPYLPVALGKSLNFYVLVSIFVQWSNIQGCFKDQEIKHKKPLQQSHLHLLTSKAIMVLVLFLPCLMGSITNEILGPSELSGSWADPTSLPQFLEQLQF